MEFALLLFVASEVSDVNSLISTQGKFGNLVPPSLIIGLPYCWTIGGLGEIFFNFAL